MEATTIQRLTSAVQAVCPIVGLNSAGVIAFRDEATPEQKNAAAFVVAAFDPARPTVDMISAERDRRLALGFDYDFGDGRGVHRIGTTLADMKGWGEVSTYAGALLDSGDVATKIAVVTDTGPCEVTAPEWRAIEIAAAVCRQPIWAKSFVLSQSLPTDYMSDVHWS